MKSEIKILQEKIRNLKKKKKKNCLKQKEIQI